MNVWKMEPSLISGFVAAVIVLAVAFGAPISDAQTAAVLGAVAAGLMMVQAFVTRQNVYSPESVRKLTGEIDPAVPAVTGHN